MLSLCYSVGDETKGGHMDFAEGTTAAFQALYTLQTSQGSMFRLPRTIELPDFRYVKAWMLVYNQISPAGI